MKSALEECHRHGWLISGIDDEDGRECYAFPSPLHESRITRFFSRLSTPPPFSSLYDLCDGTIRRFQTARLANPARRAGPAFLERPPEAQYQDEFYRSHFEVTDGCVDISPEWASQRGLPAGRVDFYIPSMRWAIEITRDGNRLKEHSNRFTHGAYSVWLTNADVVDYIILDFRSSPPSTRYPGKRALMTCSNCSHCFVYSALTNLYHVIFDETWSTVSIVDNMGEGKGTFLLVNDS